jgi:hypothetical protein
MQIQQLVVYKITEKDSSNEGKNQEQFSLTNPKIERLDCIIELFFIS